MDKMSLAKKGFAFLTGIMFLNFNNLFAAANGNSQNIKWGALLMGLFGGLALFLYGMDRMSEGMKKSAGDKMRSILAALTNNKVVGLFVGAFVTMVIQSSSATTVMLVSFVQAQLMTFAQSLGVILGADIGTTITAQLVAFKLTDYALLAIAIGFAMRMFSKKENTKHIGDVVMGFGILFFGMKLMSDSMKPLRTYQEFIDMLGGLENPVLGILVGAAFTALIQSSSAFTGIVIVLAQQQLITLEAGIPLIMGSNIGTCITAALACIGTTREAKRVALAHALFKVGGVLLFIWWIPTYAELIRELGFRFNSTGTARQIANAHTIFNVSLAFAFLPFTGLFAQLVTRLLPDKEETKGIVPAIWHLDEKVISTPSVALDLARTEASRMAKIVERMLVTCIHPFTDGKSEYKDPKHPQLSLVESLEMREQKVDFLDEKIGDYLYKIGRQELSNSQSTEVYSLLSILKDLESIGDVIQKNIVPHIAKKEALQMDFSEEGKAEIKTFHLKVSKQVSNIQEALKELNPEKSKVIMGKAEEYLDLESKLRFQHLERVRQGRKESMQTHEVHMEVMDLIKQINVYIGNIAKTINLSSSFEDFQGVESTTEGNEVLGLNTDMEEVTVKP